MSDESWKFFSYTDTDEDIWHHSGKRVFMYQLLKQGMISYIQRKFLISKFETDEMVPMVIRCLWKDVCHIAYGSRKFSSMWSGKKICVIGLNTFGVKTEYSRQTRSLPKLLMPWLLVSPGHQQLGYWLCRINRSLSSRGKDFNYLHCLYVEKLLKVQIYFYVDRLVQDRRNSIANALELRLSWTNPSMFPPINSAELGLIQCSLCWSFVSTKSVCVYLSWVQNLWWSFVSTKSDLSSTMFCFHKCHPVCSIMLWSNRWLVQERL